MGSSWTPAGATTALFILVVGLVLMPVGLERAFGARGGGVGLFLSGVVLIFIVIKAVTEE